MNTLVNLKEIRQKHGFSTRALAEKLGVDHSFIIRVEQGRKPCSIGFIKNWLDLT